MLDTDRILSREQIAQTAAALRLQGKKIVFTNGCFDILHAGHVAYLEQARQLGDVLIVGLNSDASVSRLKGPLRPVNREGDRARVIAGLRSVDYVAIFSEDTPYELIDAIRPDILVKGGDWRPEDIVGSNLVLASGGKVLSLDFVAGLSSTALMRRIYLAAARQEEEEGE